jgi:type I restriction enzyme S subunit
MHNTGKTLDKSKNKGTIRDYITTSNLYWGYFELDSVKQMGFQDSELDRCTAIKGDLLICEGGDAGRSSVWEMDYPICFQNHIHRVRFFGGVNAYYAFYYMMLVVLGGSIANYRKGIGIQGISSSTLDNIPFPLPPLAEQRRIVARIEELLPHIAAYDVAEQRLSALNTAFPDALKKSILQAAVQGKLVEQDPADEPASALLERIRAEKEKLIKAGKIKRDKNGDSVIFRRDNSHYEKLGGVERCIDDEIPFDVPDSWAWVRLGSVVYYSMGKTPPRKETEYWDNTHSWVSIADMISDGVITATKEGVSQYAFEKTFRGKKSAIGTLIMSFKLTVGKVSLLGIEAFHNEAIISIYPLADTDNIIRDYLFKTLPLISQSGDTKNAIKGNTLNSDSIDALLIPLPPLPEQRRIVAKINELPAFAERLITSR